MQARTIFGAGLKARIEKKYNELGYALGWRFLYSPENVLEGARIAFIGVNPGGDHVSPDHAEFAMTEGSAYAVERWNAPPGESKLQRQVLALFKMIGERPEKVLAGNLVPFRSPSWDALARQEEALEFGRSIWGEILERAEPRLVVGMGKEATSALKDLLGVRRSQNVLVGWGRCKAEHGVFAGGTFVGIPHLSRFGIVTRAESMEALQILFGDHYRPAA